MDDKNNLSKDYNNSDGFLLEIKPSKVKARHECPPRPNPKPPHLRPVRPANNPKLKQELINKYKKGFRSLGDFKFKRMKVVKSASEMPLDSKIHKGETPVKIKDAMRFFRFPASDYVGNSFNSYKKSKNLGLMFRGSSASKINDREAVVHNFSQITADTV